MLRRRPVQRDGALARRPRGSVPEPRPLPDASPAPVLALGGYLKTTCCVARGTEAFVSRHVGDLDTEAARSLLIEVAHELEAWLDVEARTIAVDLHPDYPSVWAGERLAAARAGRVIRVQHHLAHAAAVLAEHGRFPALGESAAALVLDGTGYGTDGVAWGCELLLVGGDLAWRRLGHGTELALVGGERAVQEPWRVACAALAQVAELELLVRAPLALTIEPERLLQVARLAQHGDWPRATGAGRVFEAAGALLGLCARNGYEGEAAARLEALASSHTGVTEPWRELELDRSSAATLPSDRLLAALVRRVLQGESHARIAAGFHATFCRLAGELATRTVPSGVRTIAVGGGCLVNRLLASGLVAELEQRGFEPLLPVALPAGDGGLAYGQAVVASIALARSSEPHEAGGAPCA